MNNDELLKNLREMVEKKDSKRCPSCGHCPTCGHTPYRLAPYPVYPIYPWYYVTNTTGGTTSGNVTTFGQVTATNCGNT